ncbi:hypothetical protein [Paenibacillus segetis]|uniref:hypothetical protein n=1 Tax=Paenibacillus segetis TaxID=1325360 RepID=UPI00166DEA2F|nr:hypothetical protein [Paenibacillus segetis]
MPRVCPQCQQATSLNDFICSHCGVELIDNGELLNSLNLNDNPSKQRMIPTIFILVVIAISVFLLKFLL